MRSLHRISQLLAEAHLRRPHALDQQRALDGASGARDVDSRALPMRLARANASIVAAPVESSIGTADRSMT